MIKVCMKVKVEFIMLASSMLLVGCDTSELVEQHINDTVAASGDVVYYASMNEEERKSLCEDNHIEISGVVSKDGSYFLNIGDIKTDGIEVHCNFDDKNEDVDKGDFVTVDGVCDSSLSDSMYLYGCRLSEHIKQEDLGSEESEINSIVDTTEDDNSIIKSPIASIDCEGKKYDEIESIFKDAGFINILMNAVEQNAGETLFTDGDVIIVSAGDQAVFEKDEELQADVEIAISYCLLVNSQEEKASENVSSAYTITDMTNTMYASSTINIRSGPDTNATKLGTLTQNEEVAITGKVDNGWYRISYNGSDGFVKGDLLLSERKVIQEVTTNSNTSGGSSNDDLGGNGNSPGVTVPSIGDTQGNLVWIPTKGGTKYHSNASCSGMDNPIQVTLENAEANGYTPCKKCH